MWLCSCNAWIGVSHFQQVSLTWPLCAQVKIADWKRLHHLCFIQTKKLKMPAYYSRPTELGWAHTFLEPCIPLWCSPYPSSKLKMCKKL
jgi:hypothetical protein